MQHESTPLGIAHLAQSPGRSTMLKLINLRPAIATLAILAIPLQPAISVAQSAPTQEIRVAQLFYPPASSPQVIAVTGQGNASVPADAARLDFVMTNQSPDADIFDPGAPNPQPRPKPEPITAAALDKIVQVLKTAGVPADKIKVNINPLDNRRFRYDRNTSISVDVEKPTQQRLGQLVKVVNQAVAAGQSKIFLTEVYVQYSVTSCKAVEDAAYLAAMNDAKLRANAIAKATGAQLADPPSVAELPFLGRFYSPCSQSLDVIGAVFRRPSAAYNPAEPAVVEVYREIAVTYRITAK
jgi:uncharacterized protein YggE